MANANLIFNHSLTAHRSKMRMKERRAASEIKLSFFHAKSLRNGE